MSIRKAELSDFDTVKEITAATISEIYPDYYPKGAIDFFLEHHSDDNITNDIKENKVFLCLNSEQMPVGTVTIKENEICRLFVLPNYQGSGYGRELLDYAEKEISAEFAEILIDASLPAKSIYLKRGYRETEYRVIKTKYGNYLCYDIMVKQV